MKSVKIMKSGSAKSLVIRYDDGREEAAQSYKEAAKLLGTSSSLISKYIKAYMGRYEAGRCTLLRVDEQGQIQEPTPWLRPSTHSDRHHTDCMPNPFARGHNQF